MTSVLILLDTFSFEILLDYKELSVQYALLILFDESILKEMSFLFTDIVIRFQGSSSSRAYIIYNVWTAKMHLFLKKNSKSFASSRKKRTFAPANEVKPPLREVADL